MDEIILPREDIDGWFDWPDLYKSILDNAGPTAHFVEVGAWMGKSACFMAEHIKKSKKQIKFDCVDIWDDDSTEIAYSAMIQNGKAQGFSLLDLFENNLKKYGVIDYVKAIKNTSVSAAAEYQDNSLDLIFIDAAHDFDPVKADLNAWWPKLKVGGHFAGHDYFYSPDGVQRAVKLFCQEQKIAHVTVGQCWHIIK